MSDESSALRLLSRTRTPDLGMVVSIAFVTVAFAASRIWLLDEPALWRDEAFSIYYAKRGILVPWGPDWGLEPTPPLYYSLLALWTTVVGADEPVLRLLSALLSAGMLVVVFRIAASFAGGFAGVIAVLLIVLLPGQMEYSVEVRAYALEGLLIATAMWTLSRVMVLLEQARPTSLRALLQVGWPLLPACSLSVYTHATALLFVAAAIGTLFVYAMMRPATRSVAWLATALLAACIFAAIIPELRAMRSVSVNNAATLAWIPLPTPRYAAATLRDMVFGVYNHRWITMLPLTAALLVATVWAAFQARRQPVLFMLGIVLPSLGWIALVAASMAQPVLLPRTALWTTLPWAVLLGCTLARYRADWRVNGAAIAVAILMLAHGIETGRERARVRDWSGMVERVLQQRQPGDVLATIDTEDQCLFAFYFGERVPSADRRVVSLGSNRNYQPNQIVDIGCNRLPPSTLAELEGEMARGHGVWILRDKDENQRRAVDEILAALDADVTVSTRIEGASTPAAIRLARSP